LKPTVRALELPGRPARTRELPDVGRDGPEDHVDAGEIEQDQDGDRPKAGPKPIKKERHVLGVS